MHQNEQIKSWYNQFSKNQKITGVNVRHYTIANKLISLGLKKNSTVLEIGCGIGTLTGLLAKKLPKGHLVAADISDESIKIAQSRLSNSTNVEFIVTDMSDFYCNRKFDFVVLPDVMEHIPVDQHEALFKTIRNHIHPDSFVLIHIPHPRAIDYLRINDPDKMQVIDQALSAEKLISDAYAHDFLLDEYKAYTLTSTQFDYVFVVFSVNRDFNPVHSPKSLIIFKKLMARLNFLFH